MKKIVIICFAIIIGNQSYGQESEFVYLNKKWKPTKESKARIIREITKLSDTLFKVTEFDANKSLLMTGEYSSIEPMIENGHFEFFDNYSKAIIAKGQYKNGLMVGNWIYDHNKIINYDLESYCLLDSSDIEVIVQEMPKFQGKDLNAYRNYIASNLVYPPRPAMQAVSGSIFIEFTINKSGKVCNPKIVIGVDNDLDREALRVISQSPNWTPAKQNGEPVNLRFTFPIVFFLE